MTTAQARIRGIGGERDTIQVSLSELRRLGPNCPIRSTRSAAPRAKQAEARQKLTETKEAVTAAESEDRQRLADHRRGKLAKPPKFCKPEADSDLEAAEEQIAVLAVAAADSEQDLRLAIEGNREAITARLDAGDREAAGAAPRQGPGAGAERGRVRGCALAPLVGQ